MKQQRFLFYTTWKKQIEILSDEQAKRFVLNLIRYAEGEDPILPTDGEKLMWYGIEPSLDINKTKYTNKVLANRENGKLGGAPAGNKNAIKEKTTQNNLISDNREVISDDSKGVIDKFQKNKDDYEKKKDNKD